MSNHSLAKIKLKANEFIQEYQRQETEREYQKQRLKQNIMIQIMSSRHKSQSSQSNVREIIKNDQRLIQHNSRTLSANLSRATPLGEDKSIRDEKKSMPNASRVTASIEPQPYEKDVVQNIGAEVTFKMPKNRDSYILVEGQSQKQEIDGRQENDEVQQNNSNILSYKEQMDANQTLKKSFQNDYNPSIHSSFNKQSFTSDLPAQRKFRFAEPQVQPDSEEHQQTQQIADQTIEKPDQQQQRGGVFLTMDQNQSMEITHEADPKKNYAFDIVMDKSEPIQNIDELRRKKIESMERQRQQRMEDFKKKQEVREQKRLDASLSKVRASQGSYSKNAPIKISDDPEPEPPKSVNRKKMPDNRDHRHNNVVPYENIVQESQYSVKPSGQLNQRSNYLIPTGKKLDNGGQDYDHTPKTVTSETRTKSRNKNTIFRQSPRRADKSASKYSQQPKIEPKDRKNSFAKQSNKKLMINAVTNVCLPGELNRKDRQKLVQVLENESSEFFVFLFKQYSRKVIKAIYTLDHSQTILQRIYGEKAPFQICSEHVKNFYRFDSGSREFKKLDGCKSFSFVVHAIDLR